MSRVDASSASPTSSGTPSRGFIDRTVSDEAEAIYTGWTTGASSDQRRRHQHGKFEEEVDALVKPRPPPEEGEENPAVREDGPAYARKKKGQKRRRKVVARRGLGQSWLAGFLGDVGALLSRLSRKASPIFSSARSNRSGSGRSAGRVV